MAEPRRSLLRRGLGRVRRTLRGTPPRKLGGPGGQAPKRSERQQLLETPLFDVQWYSRCAGVEMDRATAVDHFLAQPLAERPAPNPLFDRGYYFQALPADVKAALGDRDPFTMYLGRRHFGRPTHPLFDTKGYAARNPEAVEHPQGPLGHYLAVGAAQGLQPNGWMQPDEAGKYPDLRGWLIERYTERAAVASLAVPEWADRYAGTSYADHAAGQGVQPTASVTASVTVIVDAGVDAESLASTLDSLATQRVSDLQVLLIDRGRLPEPDVLVAAHLPGRDVRIIRSDDGSLPAAHNEAVSEAGGQFVAFLAAGDTWEPHRAALLAAVAERTAADAVLDDMARTQQDGSTQYAAGRPPPGGYASREAADLGRLFLRRQALLDLGGFDTALLGGWKFDLVLRASRALGFEHVPVVGTRRDVEAHDRAHQVPRSQLAYVDPSEVQAWADVALNRRLIDWAALAGRTQDPATISVIIPTYDDAEMTTRAVESVLTAGAPDDMSVQCIVWDNGSSWWTAARLDYLGERFPELVLVHSPVNHGFALGNNLALPYATGATVMFLNNDTEVPEGWLDPVVRRLSDPGVLAVQSLLIYPSGSVQSAGVAFPSTGGIPHAFLAGYPVEDTAGVDDLDFHGLTAAALAMRYGDAVALEGFDPIFTNGMEDVDICMRLRQLRPGTCKVVTAAPVVHFESRTPGRLGKALLNRRVLLDRWRGVAEPRDDVRLWAAQGYTVLDHQLEGDPTGRRRDLMRPAPVLVRTARLQVHEHPRPLRWAIKNPAPAGPEGEVWGDTHFSRSLARALRDLGQQVVEDRRPEFDRASGRHDDVSLVLRGLAPYSPSPEHVTIGWVISHPELMTRAEAQSYDLLLAASAKWAQDTAKAWNIRVEPLLQATDPERFHPDTAVPDTGPRALFVGTTRGVYRPIVRDAVDAGLPLSIYGHGWERFVDERYIKGVNLPNAELSAAYRSAGVVLNDHWDDMRRTGFLSNRLFDAVASGARVVTDEVLGLRDVFGESVQVYRDTSDLARLGSLPDPDAVFGDDAARRTAAARIHREHSFRARAQRLVELAHGERARRGFTD